MDQSPSPSPADKAISKNLWKQLSPKHKSPSKRTSTDDFKIEPVRKTITIANFLHDLHVETQSNVESEILDVVDLKYSESFKSLQAQRPRQMSYVLKLLTTHLREVHTDLKHTLDKFIRENRQNLYILLEKLSQMNYRNEMELLKKNQYIAQLETELKQIKTLKVTEVIKEQGFGTKQFLNRQCEAMKEYLRQTRILLLEKQSQMIFLRHKATKSSESLFSNGLAEKFDKLTKLLYQKSEKELSRFCVKLHEYHANGPEIKTTSMASTINSKTFLSQVESRPPSTKRFERKSVIGSSSRKCSSDATQGDKNKKQDYTELGISFFKRKPFLADLKISNISADDIPKQKSQSNILKWKNSSVKQMNSSMTHRSTLDPAQSDRQSQPRTSR